MKLQVLSDIHLEFGLATFDFPVVAPYLALCGDIGDPATAVYKNFLALQATRFEKVFILAGNHEFYHKTVGECKELIRNACQQTPEKLIFLDRSAYELPGGYVVLGTTLWSYVTPAQEVMVKCFLADFRQIRSWRLEDNQRTHAEEVQWLQKALQQVAREDKKALVLTHHAPSTKGTASPQHENSPISSAFSTDLEYLIGPPVCLFAFGHSHFSTDQYINGVRVVSNQAGYPDEGIAFDPAFCVELQSFATMLAPTSRGKNSNVLL